MGKARILLVDNNIDFLRARKELLQRHGYDVLTAMDVKDALAILKDTQVHLAVVNYRLRDDRDDKDDTGLDVLREMNLAVPRLVITQLEGPALFEAFREVRRPINGMINGPTLGHDVLRKGDEKGLLDQIERLITQCYNIQLLVGDSEAIGKVLRYCRTWGLHDGKEIDILFQALLRERRDCSVMTVTRLWTLKDASQVVHLRIRVASKRGIEHFTVKFGTSREVQIAEANSPHPIYRRHMLRLAALAYPGTFGDRILDRLPWLERVAKPVWEIFKVALKFVK